MPIFPKMQRRSFSEAEKLSLPRPKRSLSQNFLVDGNIARKIVDALSIDKDDRVLEIGAGTGALTKFLVSGQCILLAVEKDRHLAELLEGRFEGLRVIPMDFLKLDLLSLFPQKSAPDFLSARNPEKIKVVGNIPYNLTTKIILHLIKHRQLVSRAVLTLQKEFARRLVAVPNTKSYGSLTVFLSYFGKVERLFNVSRNCFRPKPDVDSTVVRLEFYDSPPIQPRDEEFFFKTIRGSFGKRRKMLLNALSTSLGLEKSVVERGMRDAGIAAARRGESLSIEEFVKLSDSLGNYSS